MRERNPFSERKLLIWRKTMEKDKPKKDEEISAQDLEQVSGGLTTPDLSAGKVFKEMPSIAVNEFPKINANVIK